MPNLTDLPLKLSYRTGRDDLARDFFVPCLKAAVLYRRAAGYFTSAGLALAAGSGKTLAALVLASKVAERNRPLVLVVVCPFINLCRQWIREIATFGVDAVPCFEGRQRWQVQLEEGHQRLAAGLDQVLLIVATNATFQSDAFQCRLRPRVDAGNLHHLLIADEVHNLGADQARNALPEGIALRLGLSATPGRHFDSAGTAAVLDYFGPIVYQYTLSQAIADGRLCRYRYHPILVDLTDAEADGRRNRVRSAIRARDIKGKQHIRRMTKMRSPRALPTRLDLQSDQPALTKTMLVLAPPVHSLPTRLRRSHVGDVTPVVMPRLSAGSDYPRCRAGCHPGHAAGCACPPAASSHA